MENFTLQITDNRIIVDGEYAGFIQYCSEARCLVTFLMIGKTEEFLGKKQELNDYIHSTIERCKRGEIRVRATINATAKQSRLHACRDTQSSTVSKPTARKRNNTEKNGKLLRKTRSRQKRKKLGN